jgi:hypothetical protein
MARKIKYSIRPSKEVIALKPILPFVADMPERADFSLNSLSFFDLNNQHFLSDWMDPTDFLSQSEASDTTDASNGSVTAIMGNLLPSLSPQLTPIEISRIDNIPIHFLEDIPNSKIAHIHKSQSKGELTVFCQASETHKAGDFIYTLGTQETTENSESVPNEIFSYTLVDKHHKEITLQLSIQLSEEDLNAEFSDLGVIQEEDLMMSSLAKTRGVLPNLASPNNLISREYTFLPIEEQYSLKSMHLSNQKHPLLYELSHENTQLSAKHPQTKQTIFSATLHPTKGFYDFELHQPVDRPTPANLMSGNFKRTKSSLYQDIATKTGKIYELSFYFNPIKDILAAQTQALPINRTVSVELWWAGLLIGVIELLSETLKGYHFTLEGHEETSRLEFILPENNFLTTQDMAEHLDMATLVPEEQAQIRFELGFQNQLGETQQFPITLNLEHEVLVSQAAAYTITMDDLSPYKKIVLAEQLVLADAPATTLNIEKIFDQMQIPESHRHVEIEQLAQSNIYEIKISDSSDKFAMPITVADIELKFDGGNAGLEMLMKYLTIDI